MMNFIKTVRTNNGNYAVYFRRKNTGYMVGVYLNRDGHLIRPMGGKEAKYSWQEWAANAKSVVPQFYVRFLTIGRELEKFYLDFDGTENNFSSVSEAQKWVEEMGLQFVRTEKYDCIPFMGKTITECAVWYLDPEDEEPNHLQNGNVVTGAWYFNVIS